MKQPLETEAVSFFPSFADDTGICSCNFTAFITEGTEFSRDHRPVFSPVKTGYIPVYSSSSKLNDNNILFA